jgi:hypothetical protein
VRRELNAWLLVALGGVAACGPNRVSGTVHGQAAIAVQGALYVSTGTIVVTAPPEDEACSTLLTTARVDPFSGINLVSVGQRRFGTHEVVPASRILSSTAVDGDVSIDYADNEHGFREDNWTGTVVFAAEANGDVSGGIDVRTATDTLSGTFRAVPCGQQ